MILDLLIYLIVAMVILLGISGWDNGRRWGMKEYISVAFFWPVSIPITLFVLIYWKIKTKFNKYKNENKRPENQS